jgi:hypothetical protein
MTENPYQSPRASLDTDAVAPRRPGVIYAAMWLMAVSFAFGLVSILLEDGLPDSLGSVVGLLFFVALTTPLVLLLLLRRNWVRWLTIAIIALGFLFTPWSRLVLSTDFDSVIYILQASLQGLAVILLLLPSSGRWYRPNNSFKPNSHQGGA